MTGSVNPANNSYVNRQPYITVSEFLNSPIGATIDTTNLVPDGNYASQTAALQALIYMASADADNICLGALGTLCATLNTEQGRFRANRQGQIIVHPAYWPILEVDSFAVGTSPSGQTVVPVSAATCWIEERQFTIVNSGYLNTSNGPLSFGAVSTQTSAKQFCTYTYVNGWFNQFLSAGISAGATSLTVPSYVGLYPGMSFTIWDGSMTETVTVSPTWTQSTTVTLSSPTAFQHSQGVNVSTLPASVKQAVIHLTVAAIKQRGEGGLVIAETGEPTGVGGGKGDSSMQDLNRAYELLHSFLQVWGRT